MKIIGLTGGIGSGKSTVAKLLEKKGFPVYYSDDRAKSLMNENSVIISQLKEWYGDNVYLNQKLNRAMLAKAVFGHPKKLAELNALVHPVVFEDFAQWKKQYFSYPFVFKEAAILFESGSYKDCHWTLNVSAQEEIRVQRVLSRDKTTREDVLERMDRQWSDEQREARADFTIKNNGSLDDLKKQVTDFILYLNKTINTHEK